jgi:hypothetical protein
MKHAKLKPGGTVVLTELPPGFLGGLPTQDKKAIADIVGKPIELVGYESDGRAELRFTDRLGIIHLIYVRSSFIKSSKVRVSKRRHIG